MRLNIPNKILKEIIKENKINDKNKKILKRHLDSWSSDEDISDINSELLNLFVLKNLNKKLLEIKKEKRTREQKYLLRQLKLLMEIKSNPEGAIVKTLQGCESAMKEYMKSAKDYIIFEQKNNVMYPYLIKNISYEPSRPYHPAHVEIKLVYIELMEQKKKEISIYSHNIRGGNSVKKLLDEVNLYLSNDKLFSEYEEELKRFNKYKGLVGKQFIGSGYGSKLSSWGEGDTISLEREGTKSRLIIDEDQDPDKKKNISNLDTVDFLIGKEDYEFKIPYHLNLYMFSLVEHDYMKVHVNNVESYVYDPSLISKLVLPKETIELVDILVEGTKDIMEDIVKGKTGGIIVMSTGVPGTGKTLTAEVYSEVVERPLYVVQSSQLGIKIEDLEKNLKEVLERANRWNAILLIDEADVYVHERGDDLVQNAVVGVFLRVLEYYRGILFMTSNRETLIDDAILSRATAHLRYAIPTKQDAIKIWKILAEQFKIEVKDTEVNKIVDALPNASGRDIKSLLKLAKLLAKRKKIDVDCELLNYVSKFIDINSEEEKKTKRES